MQKWAGLQDWGVGVCARVCGCGYHVSVRSSHLLTGGTDKTAIVFHKDSKQILATLRGHTKKVTGAVYHPREVPLLPLFLSLPFPSSPLSLFIHLCPYLSQKIPHKEFLLCGTCV